MSAAHTSPPLTGWLASSWARSGLHPEQRGQDLAELGHAGVVEDERALVADVRVPGLTEALERRTPWQQSASLC